MSKPFLPPEIWAHVISFVPTKTLLRLYAINHVFFDVVMTKKYKHVIFDGEDTSRGMARKLESLWNDLISRRVESIYLELDVLDKIGASPGRPLVIHNCNTLTSTVSVNPEPLIPSGQSSVPVYPDSCSLSASGKTSMGILAVMTSLTSLTSLSIKWRVSIGFPSSFSKSLWPAVAPRLQSLTLVITTTGLNTIFPPPTLVAFPQLTSFYLTLIYQNKAEDEVTELRDSQLLLKQFLCSLQRTLQSLHISPSPPHDLSLLWDRISHFPLLTDLNIDLTMPPLASFDSGTPLYPAAFDFVRRHRDSLTSLTVYASRLPAFRKQYPAEWESRHEYVISHLRSLSIDSNMIVTRPHRIAKLLRRQNFNLESYEVAGTLSPGELYEQLALLRDTPCGSAILTSLSVSIYRLDLRLLLRLKSDLPVLQTLKLRIMHVANGSSAPITPGQFFPLKLPPHKDVHAFVTDMITCTELRSWPLRDIIILRQSCCKELALWNLVQLFAMCIPTIDSFAGTRPIDVPDHTDLLELFSMSQCSAGNEECFYGKDGVDASPQ